MGTSLEVPFGTEPIHGSIRHHAGELHGRVTIHVGPGALILDSTDPTVWLQLVNIASDVAGQLARAEDERRRHPSVEAPYICGRCHGESRRLILVATGDERVALRVCAERCADEVIPRSHRDGNGRMKCCGAGPDQRDPRTGEDLHLPFCSELDQAVGQ